MKIRQLLSRCKKPAVIAGLVVIGLGVILQLVYNVYMYRVTVLNDNTVIISLINSAVEGVHHPAPIDAPTGKVYFPDVRLVLPPSDSYMQIVYGNYGTKDDISLQVTTTAIVHRGQAKLWSIEGSWPIWQNHLEALFDQVPNLQACARGVQIFSKPQTDAGPELQQKSSKTLQNGQKLYFYTEATCEFDLTELLDYTKQIQSY